MEFLLKQAPSKEEKIAILSRSLDTVFATLFRQTLFAAFELEMHSAAEQGLPLTEEFFSQSYEKLQRLFYGDCITFDEHSCIEWARIPHFYYNFYVYQYATGIIASLCFLKEFFLEKKVLKKHISHFCVAADPISLSKF